MKLNSYLKIIVLACVYLIVSLPFIFAQELNLQYDAVGNLVTGDSFYREYDGFNHLIRIRQGNTSSGNITEEFIWHPIEERVFIKKIYWNNQTLRTTIKYLNKNTIKIKNESGTFYENYIYQDDVLVAQRDANGNKFAVHNDHLGSVSLITNPNGDVVENSFFSPFGEQIVPVTNSRFSFTGKELDSVTGHYDFMSRMTKPEWANRFIQVDRIFYDFTKYEEERIQSYYDPQLLNPYSYARNNPYKYIDPKGNQPYTIIDLISEILEFVAKVAEGNLAAQEERKKDEEKEYQQLYEEYRKENPELPTDPYERSLVPGGYRKADVVQVRRINMEELRKWKGQKIEKYLQAEKYISIHKPVKYESSSKSNSLTNKLKELSTGSKKTKGASSGKSSNSVSSSKSKKSDTCRYYVNSKCRGL